MARIDEGQARHVAHLARIELDDGEIARLVRELEGVLSHMDRIAELELAPAGPDPEGRGLEPVLRPDSADPDELAFGPETMAPDWRAGFFVVPRLASFGEREAP
jgi:aspartyl-tRNA(Asn)/glutamyl-tRNA(Gln) amidotransferase subunit C